MNKNSDLKLSAIIWGCFALFAAHDMLNDFTNLYNVELATQLKISAYHTLAWFAVCVLLASFSIIRWAQSHKQTKKIPPKIKPNTLVKFDFDSISQEQSLHYRHHFPNTNTLVFLGEIEQMPGHCIVCDFQTGKINCGFHTGNFKPLTEDEV